MTTCLCSFCLFELLLQNLCFIGLFNEVFIEFSYLLLRLSHFLCTFLVSNIRSFQFFFNFVQIFLQRPHLFVSFAVFNCCLHPICQGDSILWRLEHVFSLEEECVLWDYSLHFISHSFTNLLNVKHQNLILTHFQEIFHRVPTVIFVAEQG